jgi:AmiR/NasT family two-component response regulator
MVNATSALENAETSAIGRALASLGLGGTEFASADEVARALSGGKPTAGLRESDMADYRAAIEACESVEDIKVVLMQAKKRATQEQMATLTSAATQRKTSLQKVAA